MDVGDERMISHNWVGLNPIAIAIGSNLDISGNCVLSIILNLILIFFISSSDNTLWGGTKVCSNILCKWFFKLHILK